LTRHTQASALKGRAQVSQDFQVDYDRRQAAPANDDRFLGSGRPGANAEDKRGRQGRRGAAHHDAATACPQ
jgi:hypothetical protein